MFCHTHRPFLNYANLMVPSVLVIILWIITIVNIVLGGSLSSFGVSPRLFPLGLIGIFSAPFIHSSLAHMGANTIPFFVTGAIINGTRGTAHFLALSAAIAISSGLMVWTFGRTETTHVGASGVIFGYVGFLCVAAAIHRNFASVAIAVVVIFLYGTMLFGIFPSDEKVSWEGHLFGLLMGGFISYVYGLNVYDSREHIDGAIDDYTSGGTEGERNPILGQQQSQNGVV